MKHIHLGSRKIFNIPPLKKAQLTGTLAALRTVKKQQHYLTLLIAALMFFFVTPNAYSGAEPILDTKTLCSETQAIKIAKEENVQFCSGENGCDFSARLLAASFPGEISEGYTHVESWVVKVSQIHSFDLNGKPRFIPDGVQFVKIAVVEDGGCGYPVITGHHIPSTALPAGEK